MSERPNDPGVTPGDPLAPGRRRRARVRAARRRATPAATPSSAAARCVRPGGGRPVPAPAPVTGRYALAGWWSRVGAALIDGVIVGIGALLILALFGSVFSIGFFASDEAGHRVARSSA